MPYFDNPAGRLEVLLREFVEQPNDMAIGEAWKRVLGLENDTMVMRRLAALSDLPNDIISQLRVIDDPSVDVLLRRMTPVRRALTRLDIEAPADVIKQFLTREVLEDLSFSSSLLHAHRPERAIDAATVASLIDDFGSLLDEVTAADDLDAQLRAFLLDALGSVLRSLYEYRITGTSPVERAMFTVVGQVVTQSELLEKTRSDPRGAKIWKLLGNLTIVLSALNGSLQLAQTILPELGAGHEPRVEVHSGKQDAVTDHHEPLSP